MTRKPTYEQLVEKIHLLEDNIDTLQVKNYFCETALHINCNTAWISDLSNKVIYTNPDFFSSIGYSSDDNPKWLNNFLTTDSQRLIKQAIKTFRIYSAKNKKKQSLTIKKKDNSKLSYFTLLTPLYNNAKKLFGLSCTINNTDKCLKKDDLIFKVLPEINSLFSIFIDGIIIFDKNSIIREIAHQDTDCYFIPKVHAKGKTVYEIFPENIANLFQENINYCFKKNYPVSFEYKMHIQYQVRWFEASVSPYSKELVVFVTHDITNQIINEQIIEQKERKLRAIFDNSIQAFMIIDKKRKIRALNKKAKEMCFELYNETIEEGDSFTKFILDKKGFEYAFGKALMGRKTIVEIELDYPQKKNHWLEMIYIPLFNDKNDINGIFYSVIDISERKIAEQRLQKSKANLKAMFDSSQHLYFLIDTNYRILTYNQLAAKSAKKLYNKEIQDYDIFFDYILKEDINIFRKKTELAFKGKRVKIEKKYENEFGTVWFEYLFLPSYDAENKIFGVSFSALNITSRKITEQALIESEEKLRLFVENIPFIAFLKDEKANTILQSKVSKDNYIDLFKHDPLKNKMSPDKNIDLTDKTVNKVLSLKNGEFSMTEGNCPDGKTLLSYLFPIHSNKASSLLGGIYIDISPRKQMEEKLRKSEHLYNSTINSINQYIFVVDKNIKILLVNNFCLNFIEKYNLCNDVIGKQLSNAFPYLDKNEILEYHQIFLTGIEISKESEITIGEDIIYFETFKTPIIDNEKVVRVITTIRDITKRKLAEKALLSSEQSLRELNATKDKMFSIIGHDLRGPIGTLKSMLEYLASQTNNVDEEDLKSILYSLKESSDATYTLLENLLEWAKIQRSDVDFNPQEISLNKSITENINLLLETAKTKNIRIIANLYPESHVIADVNMVNTVLRNLISNAIKFTDKDGEIRISTQPCMQTTTDDNTGKNTEKEFINVSVIDNGIGILSEDIDKLFKIDENITTSGTAGESGTGLGLILCKELVEKNGGNIEVFSQFGNGSAFSFTLQKACK